MLMQRAESAQTVQGKVLVLMHKAAVHNECGLPMCAVTGLDLQTLD